MTNREAGEAFLRKAFIAYKAWTPSWYSIGTKKPVFPFKSNTEFIAYIDKLSPNFVLNGVLKGGWIENWGKSIISNGIDSATQDKIITASIDEAKGQYPLKVLDLQVFGEQAVKYAGSFKMSYVSDAIAKTGTQIKEVGVTVAKVAATGATLYIAAIAAIGLITIWKFMPKKSTNPRRRRR